MNVLEKILEVIKKPENYTIMCGKHVTTVDRVEEIICSHMNEKEKVTSAEIVSREVDGKTYYAIKYKEVGKDYYTVGYGSYKLDYVVCWLNEYFEFCREVKVVSNNDGWIPVEDGLPEEGEEVEVTIEEMADSAGGMIYYTKTAWVQEERWVIKRNPYNPRVIAWQPLPEPYKPKKDIEDSGARS